MATNNFKPFATGESANVTSQSDYEALAALQTGFQSGKASSAQINKALRQSSTMSAVLGQFITQASLDALDNGNVTSLLGNFITALTTNLSLGNASKRTVGTGTNQIPDMDSFSYQSASGVRVYRFPNGMCIQVGNSSTSSSGISTVTIPVAMSIFAPLVIEGLVDNWTGSNNIYDFFTVYGAQGLTTTTFRVKSVSYRGSDGKFVAQSTNFNWVAVGLI